MHDRTSQPGQRRNNQTTEPTSERPAVTQPTADHGVTFEHPLTGENEVRALCLCGWASPWGFGRKQAREAGVAHLTLVTASLRELVDEAERRLDVQRALADFTVEQRRQIREYVAAKVGERFVRETHLGAGFER